MGTDPSREIHVNFKTYKTSACFVMYSADVYSVCYKSDTLTLMSVFIITDSRSLGAVSGISASVLMIWAITVFLLQEV